MDEDLVMPLCYDCHKVLSPIEVMRFEDRCAFCEDAWERRNAAWRAGHPDRELALMAHAGAH